MMRIEDMMRDVMAGQRYLFPVFGSVVSADPVNQTVDVRPAVTVQGEQAPVLKVPVLLPGGGGWEIDFGLQAGDFVLLLFCGHVVAQWWGNQKASEQSNATLPDAVAIPFTKRVSTAQGIAIQSTDGSVKFEIIGGSVPDVKAVIGGTLGYSLLTHTHSGVTVGTGATGVPVPGPP